jgi:hypothetical protein
MIKAKYTNELIEGNRSDRLASANCTWTKA